MIIRKLSQLRSWRSQNNKVRNTNAQNPIYVKRSLKSEVKKHLNRYFKCRNNIRPDCSET